MAIDRQQQEQKDRFRAAAFTGYLMGAGKERQTFGEFLKGWGLAEASAPRQKPDPQKVIDMAERIKRIDQRRVKT